MLYKPVGKNIPHLLIYSAISAEHALLHFQKGLNVPSDFADVKMVVLSLQDIEDDLKAKHKEFWSRFDNGTAFWSTDNGEIPSRDEVSGSLIYGSDF